MPNMGRLMPKMGIPVGQWFGGRGDGLASALFSTTQQRVIGLLFGQPDRSFYATQLIEMTRSGSGAVQRELARLERAGLVSATRQGTQKHYQANPSSPLFEELCAIARKTVGLAEPLRRTLTPLAARIDAAFVYGSVAKRTDTARSDIDLFVLSDTLDYPTLIEALQETEASLGRAISPMILKREEIERRVAEGHAFVTRVLEQPKIWIIGNDDVLRAR